MQKSDVYVVLTNNVVNAVTMDPSVADQIKLSSPNSIVKKYPMISTFRGGTGVVGEALEGDFDVSMNDSPPEAAEVDAESGAESEQSEDDVVCMDAGLAIRMFEYVHSQQDLSDDTLTALVQQMIELGNTTDNVLTLDHYEQLTGDQSDANQEFDLDDGDSEEFDSTESDSDGDELDLEEDGVATDDQGYDANSSDAEYEQDGAEMDQSDIAAIGRFMAGEIDKQELVDMLSGDPAATTNNYAMDSITTDDGMQYDQENDDFFQEAGPIGTTSTDQSAQVDPALDAQYMRGYNTGKQGGQAQQQNINTPQGAAYNSGFTAGKAGQPSVPPSKKTNESTGKNRHKVSEGLDTFAQFLKDVEKKSPVSKTVSSLFKQKKQQTNAAETHFELEQDPATSAVKIVNK